MSKVSAKVQVEVEVEASLLHYQEGWLELEIQIDFNKLMSVNAGEL